MVWVIQRWHHSHSLVTGSITTEITTRTHFAFTLASLELLEWKVSLLTTLPFDYHRPIPIDCSFAIHIRPITTYYRTMVSSNLALLLLAAVTTCPGTTSFTNQLNSPIKRNTILPPLQAGFGGAASSSKKKKKGKKNSEALPKLNVKSQVSRSILDILS